MPGDPLSLPVGVREDGKGFPVFDVAPDVPALGTDEVRRALVDVAVCASDISRQVRRLGKVRLGTMVGAVGGLAFVLINAGGLPGAIVVRVLGLIACVVAVVGVLRAPHREDGVGRGSMRTYWISVGLMVVWFVVGTAVLRAAGDSDLQLAWVVLVVGLHFVPLARALDTRLFLVLGGALVAVAVVGATATLAGSGDASGWTGVAAGFVLLASALTVLAPRDTGGVRSPYAGR